MKRRSAPAPQRRGSRHVDPAHRRVILAEVKADGVNATSRKYNLPKETILAVVEDRLMREGSILVIAARLASVAASPQSEPPAAA